MPTNRFSVFGYILYFESSKYVCAVYVVCVCVLECIEVLRFQANPFPMQRILYHECYHTALSNCEAHSIEHILTDTTDCTHTYNQMSINMGKATWASTWKYLLYHKHSHNIQKATYRVCCIKINIFSAFIVYREHLPAFNIYSIFHLHSRHCMQSIDGFVFACIPVSMNREWKNQFFKLHVLSCSAQMWMRLVFMFIFTYEERGLLM